MVWKHKCPGYDFIGSKILVVPIFCCCNIGIRVWLNTGACAILYSAKARSDKFARMAVHMQLGAQSSVLAVVYYAAGCFAHAINVQTGNDDRHSRWQANVLVTCVWWTYSFFARALCMGPKLQWMLADFSRGPNDTRPCDHPDRDRVVYGTVSTARHATPFAINCSLDSCKIWVDLFASHSLACFLTIAAWKSWRWTAVTAVTYLSTMISLW